jgi:hypothetical protein
MNISWPTAAIVISVLAVLGVCVWRDPSVTVPAIVGVAGTIASSLAPKLLASKGSAS